MKTISIYTQYAAYKSVLIKLDEEQLALIMFVYWKSLPGVVLQLSSSTTYVRKHWNFQRTVMEQWRIIWVGFCRLVFIDIHIPLVQFTCRVCALQQFKSACVKCQFKKTIFCNEH